MGADGGGDRTVGAGGSATYSLDGRVLAWWASAGQDPVLTVAEPDGSSPHSVPGIDPTYPLVLSPGGTSIAWLKSTGERNLTTPGGTPVTVGSIDELWISPTSGGPGVRVVPADPKADGETYSYPVWSPDARWIAFVGSTDIVYDYVDADGPGTGDGSYRSAIYLVRSDGSDLHRLTDRPGPGDAGVAWSPDSRSLAYTGWPEGTPVPSFPPTEQLPHTTEGISEVANNMFSPADPGVFVIGVDGAGDTAVTPTDGGWVANPAWSPDGTRLAYQVDGEDGMYLAVAGMEGSTPTGPPVIGTQIVDGFAWSPDGTRLVTAWIEPLKAGSRNLANVPATIQTIAADLQGRPIPILEVAHVVDGLSWQRLDASDGGH